MKTFAEGYAQIWAVYPALFYGLAMLIGVCASMTGSWWLGLPATLLVFPLLMASKKTSWQGWGRFFLGILSGLTGYVVVIVNYDFPDLPSKGIIGNAHFEIYTLSTSSHHFGKSWLYRGMLKDFHGNDHTLTGHNIPVTVSIPLKASFLRPPADSSFVVQGRLKKSKKGHYIFIILPDTPWRPVQNSWSLTEMRYTAKQAVKKYIYAHIHTLRSAKFLTGLATGEFDDRIMAFEFNRFGLQHLMAISGFHFGIIAYFLSLIARLLFPRPYVPWFLIVGLSTYFIFLGATASVMRSWIGAMVFFCSQLVEKESSGLNALGLGLVVILVIDPLVCGQLGFKFSFASTAAILLFHNPSLKILDKIWPKRTLSTMIAMDLWDQHAYLILSFIKQGVALTMAVTVVALPMTFYYFHKFPLLSLIYNLFFPFMVSIAMLLLMLGMIFSWLPPLSNFIHSINTAYTDFVLNFTYNIPTRFDIIFYFQGITTEMLIAYLSIVFFWGLSLKRYREDSSHWNYPLL